MRSGMRIVVITLLIAAPAAANYVGVRSGARLNNILTVAKLLPLCVLILLGLLRFSQHPQLISSIELARPGAAPWLRALLLLIFAYAGFENTVAPGAEVRDPRRTVPFGLIVGLVVCAALYASIQFVTVASIGTRPTEHPLADVADLLLSHGSLFVALAVMISTYGWISGDILTSPRIVYAFAETGDAPRFLGNIHSGFQTPTFAIVIYAMLAWLLAVTGTFLWVAAVGAASSLILYSGVCAALIRLRHQQPQADAFRIPFGPVLAVLAIGISLALISALDRRQALLMVITALLASLNWWWARRREVESKQNAEAVVTVGTE